MSDIVTKIMPKGQDLVNKVIELTKLNKNVGQISRELFISETRVIKIQKESGLYIRESWPSLIFTEDEKCLIADLLNSGKTYSEVAAIFNRTRTSIINFVYKNGNKEKYNIKDYGKRKESPSNDLKKAFELYKVGKPAKEIAKIFNVPYSTIVNRIKYYGIKQLTEIEQMELGYYKGDYAGVDKETLIFYTNKGLTIKDISNISGLSTHTIQYRMSLLGVISNSSKHFTSIRQYIIRKQFGRDATKEELELPAYMLIDRKYLLELLKKNNNNLGKCAEELGLQDRYHIRKSLSHLKINITTQRFVTDYSLDTYQSLLDKGYTCQDIAEILNFSLGSIRLYLKQQFPDHPAINNNFRSVGEQRIAKFLSDNNIKFIHDYYIKIEDLVVGQESAYIDFYMNYNDLCFWIEFNGLQHYFWNNNQDTFFFPTIDEFIRKVKRDMWVKKKAKENKITFLEIPYTFNTYEKIQDLLQRVIIDGEDINNIIDYAPFYKEIEELGISINEN